MRRGERFLLREGERDHQPAEETVHPVVDGGLLKDSWIREDHQSEGEGAHLKGELSPLTGDEQGPLNGGESDHLRKETERTK